MSVHTDKVIPGGNRARYQGGIYDCIWKKWIGESYFLYQFEWYRGDFLVISVSNVQLCALGRFLYCSF